MVLFACYVALRYCIRVLLVHDTTSLLPPKSELPAPLQDLFFWQDKAIPYMDQFASTTVIAITNRLNPSDSNNNNNSPDPITPRFYLSYKQSTGYEIANVLIGKIRSSGYTRYHYYSNVMENEIHECKERILRTNVFMWLITDGSLSCSWQIEGNHEWNVPRNTRIEVW